MGVIVFLGLCESEEGFGLVATNIIVFIPHEQESKVVQPQVSWHNTFLKYFVAFFSFKHTLVLYYLWGLSTDIIY